MTNDTFDFVVIGGGSGGYAAARTAAAEGLRAVVIEGGEEIGGLCILRGCMPSKALIAAANVNRAARDSARFGLRISVAPPAMNEVMARKRKHVAEFADYRRGQLEDGRFTFIRGRAQFLNATQVEVVLDEGGRQIIEGRAFLVATGSRISAPPVPGLDDEGVLTSDDILERETLPRTAIVLGGGAIAVEMAHYLEGMGVKVTVVQRSGRLLTGTDGDLADVVEESFRQRGMEVFCGTILKSVERTTDAWAVNFTWKGAEQRVEAECVLNALGRAPATAGLGLETTGARLGKGGKLEVAPTQRAEGTGSIFAAGDVCGPLEVVHIAIAQGELAARNAARLLRGELEEGWERMDYRVKLFGVFCEPQVAAVGLSEAEAKAEGRDFLVASHPFADHGKSIVIEAPEGFVKLLAERGTGEIIGGAAVGPEATELIHEISVAIHLRATARQLALAPHYHPTLGEIWTYPAEELAERLR